jgi:hypothetical protein
MIWRSRGASSDAAEEGCMDGTDKDVMVWVDVSTVISMRDEKRLGEVAEVTVTV